MRIYNNKHIYLTNFFILSSIMRVFSFLWSPTIDNSPLLNGKHIANQHCIAMFPGKAELTNGFTSLLHKSEKDQKRSKLSTPTLYCYAAVSEFL